MASNFSYRHETIYENAYPILKKYKIPATGFIITGHVGEETFHNLDMISKKELKEMYKTGLWEFETHTHDLHNLSKNNKSKLMKASEATIIKDLNKSEKYLTKNFKKSQKTIAYPYGLMNDNKLPVIKKAGLKYGFSLEEKAVTPNSNDYYIPRILISDDAFEHLIKRWDGFMKKIRLELVYLRAIICAIIIITHLLTQISLKHKYGGGSLVLQFYIRNIVIFGFTLLYYLVTVTDNLELPKSHL